MIKYLIKLLNFKPKESPKSSNLRDRMHMTFEDELIDLEFDNVGTYQKGSRTKKK